MPRYDAAPHDPLTPIAKVSIRPFISGPAMHRTASIVVVASLLLAIANTSRAAAAPSAAPTSDALLADARQALADGDGKRALELADKAVAAEPSSAEARLLRAGLLDASGETEKALADCDKLVELRPQDAQAHQLRGVARFKLGRFKESVADFDKVLEIRPASRPHHWQRGIALYYAGDFKAGRDQFELHKTVNPADVENAAWHFLCVARLSGADEAKKVLIPVVGDARIPMAEVQKLFAGEATDEDVIQAATAGNPDPDEVKDRLFYAHLYIGLHHEALGNAAAAKEHIDLAAGKYAQNHYMGWVARVHAKTLKKPKPAGPASTSK
jgi:lipoprotein NlpI